MILPEKEPFLIPVLSSFTSSGLLQTKWILRGLLPKWKTRCLMLRTNIPASCATTTNTGKISPCGTHSRLLPTVSGGTHDSQLLHTAWVFPHFPSEHTQLTVRPHVHSGSGGEGWRGHLSWPTSPFRSQTRPLSIPMQSPHLSPQEVEDSVTMLSEGSRWESLGAF